VYAVYRYPERYRYRPKFEFWLTAVVFIISEKIKDFFRLRSRTYIIDKEVV